MRSSDMKMSSLLTAVLSANVVFAGGNLVLNPSFESDEIAFVWEKMDSPGTWVKDKGDPRYDGRFDSAHVKDGTRAWFFRCDIPQGRNSMVFRRLPVTPGKRYTFSARYYIGSAEGPVMVWGNTHQHDENGKTSGYYNTPHYDETPGRWNEWHTSFYVPKNSKTTNVAIIFGGRMSVWVDDVRFFEDPEPPTPPPVGAILGEGAKVSVSWLSPLAKAVPKGVPSGLKKGDGIVPVDSAQNEREHFQIVLSAKKPLNGVRVSFDGFRRRRPVWSVFGGRVSIDADALRVREVKFVPVANAKNPAMNRLHPDPVVAFSGSDVAAGDNLVLLFTVHTPKGAAVGEYDGTVSVCDSRGELTKISVRLRVRGFAVPDSPAFKACFYSNPDFAKGSYRKFDPRPSSEINDDIHRMYKEIRICCNQAVKCPMPKWRLENGRVVVTDWAPFENEVRRLNREYGLKVFPCPFIRMLGDNSGWFKSKGRGVIKKKNGRTVGDGAPATPFGGYYDEPVGRQRVIEALRQFLSFAKSRLAGLDFFWYIYDEPCHGVMDSLPGVVKAYADALPELDLLVVTTPYADVLPSFRTRGVPFDERAVNPRIVNFRETLYYQYASTIEDSEYFRNRFYTWQVYMADGIGALLWNVTYCGNERKGFHNPWTELTAMYDHAKPTIFYPPREGKDEGVVMSMRMINISDAIDDFDYIKLYEARKGRDAAKRLLSEVLPEPLARTSSPQAFLSVRRKIADVLEDTRQ